MGKFTCLYLPLMIVLISLIIYPTFAHKKLGPPPPPQDPQTPPQEPPKNKPPPKKPRKDCPPPPPRPPKKRSPPKPPKIDPPPPEEPKQEPPPPEEPKQEPPPPEEPKQEPPPPEEPKQEPPPPEEPKQEPPPPEEPKLGPPPPEEPKQEPPPPEEPPKEPKRDSPPPGEPDKPTPFHNRYENEFEQICAFGDSYTDTGNAKFMGSLTISFSGSLSTPYRSNRLSDGRLVIDYITDAFGLRTLPPYQERLANFTNGVNFAIAGATTLAQDLLSKLTRIFLLKGNPIGIMTELDWYKKYQIEHLCKGLDQKACSAKMEKVLFWVGEIGINDFNRAVGSKIPLKSIARSSVTYTVELVKTLIRNGAKKIVVQGLPPLGCLPLDISLTPLSLRDRSGCSQIVNAAVIIHNQILQVKLEFYRKMFPDVTIIYADSWKAYYNIVNDAKKYKFQEVRKTCCGSTTKQDDMNFNIQSLCGSSGTSVCSDPSQYVCFDGIHPTESMNYRMTEQYINHGCCSPPFEELMKKKKAPNEKAPKEKAPNEKAPKEKAPKAKASKEKAPKKKAPK